MISATGNGLGDAWAMEFGGDANVTWYAADVHHFAMSLNPDYRYEAGRWGGAGRVAGAGM